MARSRIQEEQMAMAMRKTSQDNWRDRHEAELKRQQLAKQVAQEMQDNSEAKEPVFTPRNAFREVLEKESVKARYYDEVPGGMAAMLDAPDEPETVDDFDPTEYPWYVRLNPCTLARYKALAPIGDAVAKLAVECPCCNGFRMIVAALAAFTIGLLI